jgi:hypothetical protein
MSVSVSVQENLAIAGVSFNSYTTITGNNPEGREDTLTAAQAASSWVKTDADTAACNLAGGHGIITGKVNVFWTGGMRYGVDCTVTVNALALDGGTGTDFPASADTTVVISQQVSKTITFNSDEVALLRIICDKRAHVDFQKADNTSLFAVELAANVPYRWDGAGTSPFSPEDPVAKVLVSCGEATAGTLKIGKLATV